jgi:3-oxoadipate enol-lactonase
MPFAPAEGTEIYYEIHGKGPHLVMCHGIGSNRLHWWQQVCAFMKEFTVVVFDHRGFGSSPTGGKGASKFTDDLIGLLDHLKIDQAHFLGQSMGGFTAVGLAMRQPERIRTLTLTSGTGGLIPMPPDPKRAQAFMAAKNYLDLAPVLARQDAFSERHPELFFLFEELTQLNSNVDIRLLLPELGQLKPDLPQFIGAKFPLLLLAGGDDHGAQSSMRELAKAVPSARFDTLANTGHLLFFEEAAKFNSCVLEFLRAHSSR